MNPSETSSWRRSPVRRLAVALAAVITIGMGLWWLTRPTPEQLLARGLIAGRRDPLAGEHVIRRALNRAAGRFPDAEIALGVMLARQGAWDEALRWFSAVDKSACRPDLLLTFGQEALRDRRRRPGWEALESVAERDVAERATALELLIPEYREWGDADKEIAAARALTRLDPESAAHWGDLVRALKVAQRDRESLEVATEALGHHLPAEAQRELRHHIVQQRILLGEYAAADRELATLRRSEGDTPGVIRLQIDLYRHNGRPEQALATIREVFPKMANAPAAYLTRGLTYLDLRKFELAADDLKRYVEAVPSDGLAQFKLSEAYRGLGKVELARQHRERAAATNEKRLRIGALVQERTRDPEKPDLCLQIADLYRDLGELEEARRWEERAARTD